MASVSAVEVLVLSKCDFHHHVDQRTQELMSSYASKFYFDEAAIARSILRRYKWEEYKRTVLDDVLPRKGRFAGR